MPTVLRGQPHPVDPCRRVGVTFSALFPTSSRIHPRVFSFRAFESIFSASPDARLLYYFIAILNFGFYTFLKISFFCFVFIDFAGFYHLFLSFVTDCSFQCKRTKYPDEGQRGAPDEGWMGPRSSSERASKQASTRFFLGALFPDTFVLFHGGRVLAVSRGCW